MSRETNTFIYPDNNNNPRKKCDSPLTRGGDIYSLQDGALWEKTLSPKESKNYQIIQKYRKNLLEGEILIAFPEILSSKSNSSERYLLTSTPHFHNNGVYGYKKEDYLFWLQALEKIRKKIQEEEFDDTTDPDENTNFFPFIQKVISSIEFLLNKNEAQEILQIFQNLQDDVMKLPKWPSHGDTHNHNWSISYFKNKPIISFIDLETFGLYRKGWDEGRTYASLYIHPKDQEALLEALKEKNIFSSQEWMYFWRTVAIRCMRELQLIIQNQQNQEKLKEIPLQNLREAIEKLNPTF